MRSSAAIVLAIFLLADTGHSSPVSGPTRSPLRSPIASALFAAAGPWTPKNAANSYGWWRADLGVTFGSGSAVASWADQTGKQPAATQSTGSAQPTQTANQINGQPALVFVGSSSQTLKITSFIAAPTNAEWWFVVNSTATGGSPIFETTGAQNYYPFSSVIYPNQDLYLGMSSSVRKTLGNAISDIRNYSVLSVQSATNLWTAWLNGNQQYTTATNAVANATTVYIGAGNNIGGGNLTGGLAEIWYGQIMSASDRAKTRAYITKRYGISLGPSWE
jgi:hypothetical protein